MSECFVVGSRFVWGRYAYNPGDLVTLDELTARDLPEAEFRRQRERGGLLSEREVEEIAEAQAELAFAASVAASDALSAPATHTVVEAGSDETPEPHSAAAEA